MRQRLSVKMCFISDNASRLKKSTNKKMHFGRAKSKVKKKRQVLRKKTGLGRKNADENRKRKKM